MLGEDGGEARIVAEPVEPRIDADPAQRGLTLGVGLFELVTGASASPSARRDVRAIAVADAHRAGRGPGLERAEAGARLVRPSVAREQLETRDFDGDAARFGRATRVTASSAAA